MVTATGIADGGESVSCWVCRRRTCVANDARPSASYGYDEETYNETTNLFCLWSTLSKLHCWIVSVSEVERGRAWMAMMLQLIIVNPNKIPRDKLECLVRRGITECNNTRLKDKYITRCLTWRHEFCLRHIPWGTDNETFKDKHQWVQV